MAAAQNRRDARNPDTDADRDPRAFGTIDASNVTEDEAPENKPERVESVTGPSNSTFAERAAARSGKAVQVGENKAVQDADAK